MSRKTPYPGWVYLLAGLAVGLFVAFLVYLEGLPEPRPPAAAPGGPEAAPASQFDFYKILPELELVVPDAPQASAPPAAAPPRPPAAAGKGHYVLQIAAFREAQQAERLKAELALLGLQAHVRTVTVDGQAWHRVRLGPFADREAADRARRRLETHGWQALTLYVED